MHNSKHESYINEELLLKNEDNCEQLKNKANNPNDNGNNSNNVTKCDNMEEKGNYNFVDNTKNLEKTNIPLSRGLNENSQINQLHKASFLMNKFSPNLSRKYIKTMRRLSNKFLIKYDKNFKKLFCKKCNSVFIPNVTCNIFVNPLNIQKKNKNHIVKNSISTNESVKERDECLVSYQCNHCQHITKFVYENNLPIPIENENITTV